MKTPEAPEGSTMTDGLKIAEEAPWIEWHGGEMPVSSETIVHVRLRGGRVSCLMRAGSFRWEWAPPDYPHAAAQDTVAYQVIFAPQYEKG